MGHKHASMHLPSYPFALLYTCTGQAIPMESGFKAIGKAIDGYKGEMTGLLASMISIKAVSPKSGGEGEGRRADFLAGILEGWGLKVSRYEYKDQTSTSRPSLVARIGERKRTIWLVAHTDTVAEGDRSLWKTDPYKAHIDGDRIYGRGTVDDGQAVVSCMYAMKVLKDSGADLKYNCGLVLAADEENGSRYGMQKLMDEGFFAKDDMFVVPDFGFPKGDVIEIGEKGLLWLKFTITGKQVHASTPAQGVNAFRYMSRFVLAVDEKLHKKYTKTNSLFDPAYSTFEMTRHEKNVDSTNIIPGREVFYLDCRVLPDYGLDAVLADINSVIGSEEFKPVSISMEIMVKETAPVTDAGSEVVKLLSNAVTELRGITTKCIGIGGGTCAMFPRQRSMQAAVWLTQDPLDHQPDEYAKISDMVADAKVFARLYV